MKKTFLRILPVVAAVLLATSCSKDDDGNINNVDTPQTTETSNPEPEQTKTVKIPFSVKVDDGECFSKITYALKKDGDNDIWNKVTRTFDDNDVQEGSKITLTVNGASEGSDITESTLTLKKDEGNFYFEGDIEVASEKVSDFNGETGIALVGEFTVSGTALPTSGNGTLAELMESCAHTYKTKDGEFTSKSASVTLYDQNVYLAIQMSPLQHNIDVKIGDADYNYSMNSDGQVYIALSAGNAIALNFLSKSSSEVKAGYIYTIERSSLVDLGITSGILWADHNIGGTNPEDYGDYYAWGETTTKGTYGSSNYVYYASSLSTKLTKYCNNASYGNNSFTDELTTLEDTDDAAHATNAKAKWSMPTTEEFADLKNSCYWVWTSDYSGKAGYIVYKNKGSEAGSLVTSSGTPSTNYSTSDTHIFLPATGVRMGSTTNGAGTVGNYWSSSLYTGNPHNACLLGFGSGSVSAQNNGSRYLGQSVRPVRCK